MCGLHEFMKTNILILTVVGTLLTACGSNDSLADKWCKCNDLKLQMFQEKHKATNNPPTDAELKNKYGSQLDDCKVIEHEYIIEARKNKISKKEMINKCSSARTLDNLKANLIY